ncbi:hypothetical protein AB0890_35895, partial [Streptomyces sp. NPDC005406]
MPGHQPTQTTRATRHQHRPIPHTSRHRGLGGSHLDQPRNQHLTPTHRHLRLTRSQHHTRNIREPTTPRIHI